MDGGTEASHVGVIGVADVVGTVGDWDWDQPAGQPLEQVLQRPPDQTARAAEADGQRPQGVKVLPQPGFIRNRRLKGARRAGSTGRTAVGLVKPVFQAVEIDPGSLGFAKSQGFDRFCVRGRYSLRQR